MKVLTNVEVLTEGYDDWQVACIVMARPTQSSLLYTQMIGRSTRIPEGIGNLHEALRRRENVAKKDSIVIDVVDNTMKHHFITMETLFGSHCDLNGRLISVITKARARREFSKTTEPVNAGSSFEDPMLIERVELLQRRTELRTGKRLVHGLNPLEPGSVLYYLSHGAWAFIKRDSLYGRYSMTPQLKGAVFSLEHSFDSISGAEAAARCWFLAMAGVWLDFDLVTVERGESRDPEWLNF